MRYRTVVETAANPDVLYGHLISSLRDSDNPRSRIWSSLDHTKTVPYKNADGETSNEPAEGQDYYNKSGLIPASALRFTKVTDNATNVDAADPRRVRVIKYVMLTKPDGTDTAVGGGETIEVRSNGKGGSVLTWSAEYTGSWLMRGIVSGMFRLNGHLIGSNIRKLGRDTSVQPTDG